MQARRFNATEDGRLAHKRAPNRSRRSRHAFDLQGGDGTAERPSDNRLRRSADKLMRGF
ncbi:hypothetical protein [Breoghania sp. JC706]|uniref:hypothetical protein n=1 Tax=Breoghania sp. JC706 TaxID=3117732 RepID=UPI00300B15CB